MLIGIVGKTNVGKSVFFKAATLAEVEIANRPFVTLKPNHAIGFIKIRCVDKEFNINCNPREGYCHKNNRFVPVELLDVAGLIPGAHKGRGLGLAFLDDLRQADALIHIIDISGTTNETGEATTGYDPEKDIGMLEHEIDMWYYSLLKKSWDRFARQVKQEKPELNKAIAEQFSGLKITEDHVKTALDRLNLDTAELNEEQLKMLASELRRGSKPLIIAANKIDLPCSKENFESLKEKYSIVPCSAEAELALREAAKKGYIDYVPGENNFKVLKRLDERQEKGLNLIKDVMETYGSTGVQNVLNLAVEMLGYIAVYPVANNRLEDSNGNKLPDCLLVKKGTTALELAYKIHEDIGKKFVKAVDMKTKKVIGKEARLKNNDVVQIVT